MDDVVVASDTIENGLIKLEKLFMIIRDKDLTFMLEKCKFFQQEINFAGNKVHQDGVKPGNKTEAVAEYEHPKNVHELRQFLGLINLFR